MQPLKKVWKRHCMIIVKTQQSSPAIVWQEGCLKLTCQWVMLLHREKSPDTNLHPFLFSNTEALKLILVVIQMCICFPANDDTRGKDTEAWDTSSCNGPISGGRRVTISGELDPTQEALIRAKPNLIHPRDANALNAIDYGALRHTALRSMWSTASKVAWHEVEVHAVHLVLRLAAVSWDPRWDPGEKSFRGPNQAAPHLPLPKLPTNSFLLQIGKNAGPR